MAGIAGCFGQYPDGGTLVRRLFTQLGPRVGSVSEATQAARENSVVMASVDAMVANQQKTLVIADARLDNSQTLAGRLGVDHQAGSAVLILAAFQRWGEQCVDHLEGDYVFVVMTPHRAFCARDPIGSKPFYYHGDNGQFCFASEAFPIGKALQRSLNPQRIADSLVFPLEHVDKTSTCFQGVYRLPPGHCLTLDRDGLTVRTFWRAEVSRTEPAPSLEDATERFGELLARSIDNRVMEQKTSLSLSGGVDSGTVLGFAGSRVTAISTLSPEGADCKDSRFVQMLVSAVGCQSEYCRPDDLGDYESKLLAQLEQLSEPFDYYMLLPMLVSQLSASTGHQVQLDGVEGDLTYSLGDAYPASLIRSGEITTGFREARGVYHNRYAGQGSAIAWYFSCLRQVGIPHGLQFLSRLKRRLVGIHSIDLAETLIHPAFAKETQVVSRLCESAELLYGGHPDLDEKHRRSVEHPALAAALERYDRVVSWHGLDLRHPLMDRSLLEYMLTLPWSMKSRNGWSKILLRRAGEGKIPAEVSWRQDKDENAWRFLNQFTARNGSIMRETIAGNRELLRDYICPDRLVALKDDDLLQLYGLVCWLRRGTQYA